MRRHILIALAALLVCSGCDTDRISKLEKENTELKAEVAKTNAATDFNLQEKCSNAAKSWFRENFPPDKNTILLDETNHFNRKMNKCFITVEYHSTGADSKVAGILSSWYNNISLWDVFENEKYANFAESHTMFSYALKRPPEDRVDECEVAGTKCKSLDEFNNLTRSYMSD
jgi:hypothetical protein